jgi:hypothetical protein
LKKFLILALVAVALIASSSINLVRLTIINKSGYDAFVALKDGTLQTYSLPIPWGDRDNPYTKVYTIMPGEYTMFVSYEYGKYEGSETIVIAHNMKINLTPPERPGVVQCDDLYGDTSPKDKERCIEGLVMNRFVSEGMVKTLPTLWLTKLVW